MPNGSFALRIIILIFMPTNKNASDLNPNLYRPVNRATSCAITYLTNSSFLLSIAGNECALDLRVNRTHGERTEVSFFKDAEIDAEKCFDIVFLSRDNRFETCGGN